MLAVAIQVEAVVGQLHVVLQGYLTLSLLNHVIVELNDAATVKAYQMVMVLLMSQLEHGFSTFKVMSGDDACVIKLVEYPVDGGQTNLFALIE